MTHSVLHHPRRRAKAGISVTGTAICAWEACVRFTANRLQGQSPDTTLYELLELPESHVVSDLHMAMLQQDYDDVLLERKIKKVICRK